MMLGLRRLPANRRSSCDVNKTRHWGLIGQTQVQVRACELRQQMRKTKRNTKTAGLESNQMLDTNIGVVADS
jgi:hypothetical protein